MTNVVEDISHAQEVQRPRERRTVSFPELVRLRFVWRKRAAADGADPAEEAGAYYSALADFERDHGRIVNAYWCSAIEAAVALTEKPRTRDVLKRWHSPIRRFHRVSDYATRDEPEIARLLHQCDELAIRAIEVLGGASASRRATVRNDRARCHAGVRLAAAAGPPFRRCRLRRA